MTSQHVRIGSSSLEIAPLVLGGNVFGWTAEPRESFDVLDAFIEGGGNFIDTADSYSHWAPGHTGGESELIIGKWMAARENRDDVVIATKVHTHPEYRGLSGDNVLAAADASLERLQTDRIDLYYAHQEDHDAPLEEAVVAFSQLVDEGKVRTIGISNHSPERTAEWFRIAREGGYHLPIALQPHYSLVERGYETSGLRDIAEKENLAVFPYYGLARGFLAGKYRDAADAVREGASPRAAAAVEYLDDRGRAVLKALDKVAAEREVEVAVVALAWLRQQHTVTAPIASARSVEHIAPLVQSMDLELTPVELEALDTASTVTSDPMSE